MNKEEHDKLVAEIYEENKDLLRDLRKIHDPIKDPTELFKKFTIRFYDRMGNPIDYAQLKVLLCYPKYTRVKEDGIGKFYISTNWIGLDDSLITKERRNFETTAITEIDEFHSITYRYATEEAAIIGHKKLVEYCKKFNGNHE